MIGPCLCGDPYCSYCGDPAAAELADCVDDLCEQISDFVYSPAEIAIFLNAGMCAVMNARDYANSQTSEAMQGVDDYHEYLKDQNERLQMKIDAMERKNATKSA